MASAKVNPDEKIELTKSEHFSVEVEPLNENKDEDEEVDQGGCAVIFLWIVSIILIVVTFPLSLWFCINTVQVCKCKQSADSYNRNVNIYH